MPKVIIVIVAIVIAAFLFMDSSKEPLPGSYHNEPYGFWVKFPDGWKAEAQLDDIGLWSITAFNPGEDRNLAYSTCVRVTVEELAYKVKSDFFYKKVMESVKQLCPDVKIESVEEHSVNGRDGKKIVVSYSDEGYPIKALWYLVTKEKRGYLVGGLTWPNEFDKYRQVFDDAITSFCLD